VAALWGSLTVRGDTGQDLRPISFGRILFYPSLTLSYLSDDNVTRTNRDDPTFGQISSDVRGIRPAFRFDLPFKQSFIQLGYRAQFSTYGSPALSDASGLSHLADLTTRFQITPGIRLHVNDHLVRGITELLEVDRGGELRFGTHPFTTQNARATLVVELGATQSVEAEETLDTTHFEPGANADFLYDYKSSGLSLRYLLASGPENQVFVSVGQEEVNQNRGVLQIIPTDFRRRSVGGGFRRKMTTDLTNEIFLGYEHTQFPGSRGTPFKGLTVRGSLSRPLTDTARVGVELNRSPRVSFFNVNAYYISEMARLDYQQKVGRRIALQFEGNFQNNVYPEPVDPDIDPAFAYLDPSRGKNRRDLVRGESMTLSYSLMRGMQIELAYRRDRGRSNLTAVGSRGQYDIFDYNSQGTALYLTVGWQ